MQVPKVETTIVTSKGVQDKQGSFLGNVDSTTTKTQTLRKKLSIPASNDTTSDPARFKHKLTTKRRKMSKNSLSILKRFSSSHLVNTTPNKSEESESSHKYSLRKSSLSDEEEDTFETGLGTAKKYPLRKSSLSDEENAEEENIFEGLGTNKKFPLRRNNSLADSNFGDNSLKSSMEENEFDTALDKLVKDKKRAHSGKWSPKHQTKEIALEKMIKNAQKALSDHFCLTILAEANKIFSPTDAVLFGKMDKEISALEKQGPSEKLSLLITQKAALITKIMQEAKIQAQSEIDLFIKPEGLPTFEDFIEIEKPHVDLNLKITHAQALGKRSSQEDAHNYLENKDLLFGWILDGHGGKSVAAAASEFFKLKCMDYSSRYLREDEQYDKRDDKYTLEKLIHWIHQKVIEDPTLDKVGATALLFVLDKKTGRIVTATLGDTELMVVVEDKELKTAQLIPLSCARGWWHETEARRAENAWKTPGLAASLMENFNVKESRVGGINVSRAIGDNHENRDVVKKMKDAHKEETQLNKMKSKSSSTLPKKEEGQQVEKNSEKEKKSHQKSSSESKKKAENGAKEVLMSHKPKMTVSLVAPETDKLKYTLIAACDGFWDYTKKVDMLKIISQNPPNLAQALTDYTAKSTEAKDNISVIAIQVLETPKNDEEKKKKEN